MFASLNRMITSIFTAGGNIGMIVANVTEVGVIHSEHLVLSTRLTEGSELKNLTKRLAILDAE